MTTAEFQHALQLGLGRAVLYARSHDTTPLRDIILDACLHCYAYDIQTEGTRAPYMYDLIVGLPDRKLYSDAILASLASAGDNADGVQRFRMAALLAEDGYSGAKEALYEHFRPWHTWGDHVAPGFIDLDGIDGLVFVAKRFGAVGEHWWLDYAYEKLGKDACLDALRTAAESDADAAAFLAVVEKHEEAWAKTSARCDQTTALRYSQLATGILERSNGQLMRWGQKASDEDLKRAAQGFVAETDSARQLAHLAIFARRAFPLDPELLLPLVQESRTAKAAIQVLAHIRHPAVRDLAFALVRTQSPRRGGAIRLLVENFKPGDHATVLDWFEAESDRELLHAQGLGMLELWKRHPDEASCAQMLIRLYERGPCRFCRRSAVQLLIEAGGLTDALRAECAFDSDDDIRELAGKGDSPR